MAVEVARPRTTERQLRGTLLRAIGSRAQERGALVAVMLLSTVLQLWGLARDGVANQFYAAAVRSGLDSWHNLFFSSFDPGGYAATDKPPLGFAVQAIFTKLFGFSALTLALPQALAGIASVYLLYRIVRGRFGARAGLVAALALATTPISVATARNNTIDSQLVLVALLAAWAVLRATEKAGLRWLLLAGALIGVGFLIKLTEALLILPACAAAYLAFAPERLRTRLIKLMLAGAIVAAIGGSWILAVDGTPRAQRPYIHDSVADSELSVIVGANGLGRLIPGAAATVTALAQPRPDAPTANYPAISAGGTRGEVGPPGPLRLLGRPLAGQVGWLLPLAIAGLAFAGWGTWSERRTKALSSHEGRGATLLLFGLWLATGVAFFSFAGFVHRYYLTILAPAVAAGAGIGLDALWQRFREPRRGWPQTALPLALLLSAETAALIAMPYAAFRLLLLASITLCAVPAVVLLLARYPARRPGAAPSRRAQATLGSIACAVLFAGPLLWSLAPLVTTEAAELPFAGPDLARVSRSAFVPNGSPRDADPGLIAFLRAHHDGERYWLGAFSSVTAAPVVLALNRPVLTVGGYLGGDPTTDAKALQTRVRTGEIRYFLLPDIDGIQPQGGEGVSVGVAAAVDWVRRSCPTVPDTTWRTRPDSPPDKRIDPYFTVVSGGNLYDCAGAR
jgi:4-amino-4-deoxy-L-arabinose transferase-like glycosyltransferase